MSQDSEDPRDPEDPTASRGTMGPPETMDHEEPLESPFEEQLDTTETQDPRDPMDNPDSLDPLVLLAMMACQEAQPVPPDHQEHHKDPLDPQDRQVQPLPEIRVLLAWLHLWAQRDPQDWKDPPETMDPLDSMVQLDSVATWDLTELVDWMATLDRLEFHTQAQDLVEPLESKDHKVKMDQMADPLAHQDRWDLLESLDPLDPLGYPVCKDHKVSREHPTQAALQAQPE